MPIKVSQLSPAGRFFGLFIGRSSSGKTSAAWTFPKPLLELDTDLRARGGLWTKTIMPLEEFNQIEIEQYPPNRRIEPFNQFLEKLEIEVLSKTFRYKSIIVSLTSLTNLIMDEVLELQSGKMLGGITQSDGTMRYGIRLTGPQDYKAEYQAIYSIFCVLASLPCNIIVCAHTVDKWGKPPDTPDKAIVESTIIGERLTLSQNLGENILAKFDEVYKFEAEEIGNKVHYFVKFRTDIARTTFQSLPEGRVAITGKNFYNFWKERIKE